jgi:hypothetical protein
MAEIDFTNNAVGNIQGNQLNSGLRQNNIQPGNNIRQTAGNEDNALNGPVKNQTNLNADQVTLGSQNNGNIERRGELGRRNDILVENNNANQQVDFNNDRTVENVLTRTERNALLDNSTGGAGQTVINRQNPVERGVERTEENQIQNIEGNNARIANQTAGNTNVAPGINEKNQLGNKVDLLA